MSEEERSRSGTRENRRHGTCDGETVTGNSKVTMPVGTSPSNAPRQFGRWRQWTKLLQQTNTKQPINGCNTLCRAISSVEDIKRRLFYTLLCPQMPNS